MAKSKTLIAVDTGGTFTDFHVVTSRGSFIHKVPSHPSDPSQAIAQGLKDLQITGDFELVHGTTVATNALLEKKGARVALVTTEGFDDLIEIGRQNRPHLYRLDIQKPLPLVPRSLRFSVFERISAEGKILNKIRKSALRKLRSRIRSKKIDSIAIGFIFSYQNPRHETQAGQILKKLQRPLSLSSEICPEYREYERFSTTVVNAYVTPLLSRYLKRLQKRIPQRIRIMQSNGGSLSPAEASAQSVRTLLSGPAGGALGALRVGKESGCDRLLTLDIGGTSTDLSLIDRSIELTSEAEVGGYPVKTPMIRIHTIGAGGGSIARVDAGRALRVGPESAGARPGPIAYGKGGEHVTVTDAHVWLGRLPPRHFLGGHLRLYPDKIKSPLQSLAKELKMDLFRSAEGVLQVAHSNIVRAMRVIALERGHDPRNFTLVAFGGAGPLQACELAEALEIRNVLIPHDPGILSAYGMAYADWVRDYVKTILLKEGQEGTKLRALFRNLEEKAWKDGKRQGFKKKQIRLRYRLDVRYAGQSYELTVDFTPRFRALFEAAHKKQFGYVHRGRPVEIVNLRLQARVASPFQEPRGRLQRSHHRPRSPSPQEISRVFWRGKFWKTPVYGRDGLIPGTFFRGPAVITEYSATTFVPPGWKVKCDNFKNLVIDKS